MDDPPLSMMICDKFDNVGMGAIQLTFPYFEFKICLIHLLRRKKLV